jgi:hypothetical protein
MNGKVFLVIDPDDTVTSIIKKSIVGFNPSSSIMQFKDLSAAISILDVSPVDCLIIDSVCLLDYGIDDFIHRYIDARILTNLVITTYGEGFSRLPDKVKSEYSIISKPIDIQTISTIIQQIAGSIQTEIIQQASLSNTQYNFCQQILFKLKSSIGARCILLSDMVGRILVSVGHVADISPELVTSLLGGGIATLLEAGKSLDDESQIHLSYREGSKTDLYAVNVGKDILLVIVISKTQGYSKLGTTWYYARHTALHLAEYLNLTFPKSEDSVFDDLSAKSISDELDKLFGE